LYVPSHFRLEERDELHALIRQYSFAPLVTHTPTGPFATHLPFLFAPERGPHGTLRGHMARANPHGSHLEGQEALVIFQGPHAYISPAWYLQHPSVPTWNYVAVHVYGRPHLLDTDDTYSVLRASVAQYEGTERPAWSMDSLPDALVQQMMRAIVGFEIEITRIEGKAKMSQNREVADQRQVIAVLAQSGAQEDRATAAWMQRDLEPEPAEEARK
jgi:transcriptional regulator